MIWVLIAMLGAATALATLWPLGSGSGETTERSAKAMAIYEDQLAEVARDAERGLITEAEAKAAEVEIKRRMLSAASPDAPLKLGSGRAAIFVAALAVPLAGLALYTQVGSPEMPGIPFAERGAEQQDARELQALVTELRRRLEEDAQGGDRRGWELLGSTYMNMGRADLAADAFAQVIERPDATSATWSQYAEALITQEEGIVTRSASEAIERSIALDALNPAATYYRAIELEQAGETAQARQSLIDRIAAEEAPQPWMPAFLNAANQMGASLGLEPASLPEFEAPRGPSQADIEAAAELSPEERMAFIRNMVEGLETRLKDSPDDLDGWLQLARAFVVLGEQDRAAEALKQAEPLTQALAEDDPRRALVSEGLKRFAGAAAD